MAASPAVPLLSVHPPRVHTRSARAKKGRGERIVGETLADECASAVNADEPARETALRKSRRRTRRSRHFSLPTTRPRSSSAVSPVFFPLSSYVKRSRCAPRLSCAGLSSAPKSSVWSTRLRSSNVLRRRATPSLSARRTPSGPNVDSSTGFPRPSLSVRRIAQPSRPATGSPLAPRHDSSTLCPTRSNFLRRPAHPSFAKSGAPEPSR